MVLSLELTASLETALPAAPDKVWLLVVSGPDQGKSLRLEVGKWVVGKAPECAFVLSDESVSRRHLEVRVGQGRIQIKDLGSKNGSYYRGARFDQVEVGPGASLTLGATELRLAAVATPRGLAPSKADHFGGLLGLSLAMREVFGVLERASKSDATVLIGGETGTGKEVCARAIHDASPRAKGPFVVCDAGALARSVVESELFGHKKGSFTGADRDRDGCFVAARGGTVFIDEVGELELDLQPRLLRVLEQRQVRPVGATDYQAVDVRVIAATNRDLLAECEAKRFREDLYHRLAIVPVTLPPLRQRREDIPRLVTAFIGDRAKVSAEVLALLGEYDWLGNVRQLRNVLERGMSLLGDSRELTPDLLGLSALPPGRGKSKAAGAAFHPAKEQMISEWEKSYLSDLLQRADGNIARAARIAGLGRPHLYRLIKKHGL